MAMEDIAALCADGIDVPPREVVRLNALGLRVERGTVSAYTSAAPRVAFLGECVFHEPTLGAEMWLRQAVDLFDEDDAQTWFSLRVLSCFRNWRDLPDPTNRKAVLKAVKDALKTLSEFTVRQVENALAWCLDGDAAEKGENPPPRPDSGETAPDDADEIPPRYSPEFGLFLRGTALRIGTAADMKDMTYSMMVAACSRAESEADIGRDPKEEKGQAYGDYMRALDAVRSAPQGFTPSIASKKVTSKIITTQVDKQATIKSGSSEGSSPSDDLCGSLRESLRLRPQTASMGVIAGGV